jgi:hypothetical protein
MSEQQPSTFNPLDIVTVIFVVLTVGMIAFMVLIINDPNSSLNPFPPPTAAPLIQLPTLTPSPTVTATPTATDTPTATATATATGTPTPTTTATATDTPTLTPTRVIAGGEAVPVAPPAVVATALPPLDDGSGDVVPGAGSTPTPIPIPTRSAFPFVASDVRYSANEGEDGCRWLGVAGTVASMMGAPLPGIAVEINGENFRNVQYSGTAERWGDSGFEFKIGSAPRTGTYTLQLLGATGDPVSDAVEVQTGNTCQTNVAIVEFVQNHPY